MRASHDKLLRERGLKVTKARAALLSYMMEHAGPFSREELHKKIGSRDCDLVTVYRSVSAFEDAGLVSRCDFGDGTIRFEFQPHDDDHHHHILCRNCGKVRHLDECFAENLEKLLKREGYTNISHSLEFFGTCAQCSGRSKATHLSSGT